MSEARGYGQNGKSIYSNITKPMECWLNFVVDPNNGNGLGVRSIKSNGYVKQVLMNTQAGGPAGTPALDSARTYGILGASAVTNTGSSVITGNLGEYPGTSVTGFPPGTVSGSVNVANVAAQQAQAQALAAYTAMQAQTPTTIATELGGQSLTPGTYKAASGTFTLNGTLTLTGNGVFVFQTTTTLVTGGTSTPVITLAGGASASNVYFVVGSSATLSSSNAGTMNGNVIAQTSITSTLASTINGSLIALTGAVTLSAATAVNVQQLPALNANQPNPAPGYILIQLKNNFNKYLGGFIGFVSPLSGTPLTSVTAGNAYVIVSLGTTTLAQFQAVGVPAGLTPSVGMSFIATATQAIGGTGAVETPSVSGNLAVEVVGDPNQSINNASIAANGGAWLLLQCLNSSGLNAPAPGSTIGMQMCFDGSIVSIPDGGPSNSSGAGGL